MLRWTSWTRILLASSSLTIFTPTNAFVLPLLKLPLLGPHDSPRVVFRHSTRTRYGTTLPSAGSTSGSSNDFGSSKNNNAEDGMTLTSLLLPPEDDTYDSAFAVLREWLSTPRPQDGSARYDKFGKATGGIWRSKLLGMIPVTVVIPDLASSWMARAEAAGDIVQTWPKGVSELLGRKSVATLIDNPSMQNILRGVYQEAMSPKAVTKITPFVESCLARRAQKWDEIAKNGEEVRMFDEIASFTMEVIVYAFLGDYGTEKVLQDSLRLIPEVANGFFSIGHKFWWPLNKIFPFGFGPAIKSRKEFDTMIAGVIQERRSALLMGDNGARRAGVLDTMLQMQAKQRVAGGPRDGEIEYDDEFIYDNMCVAMFAGFDTTSATLSRILQFLASNESKELDIKKQLVEELSGSVTVEDDYVEEKSTKFSSNGRESPAGGVFSTFPLLDAVVLESNRMSPALGYVIRKAAKTMEFNGFLIPEGETVCWSLINQYVSDSVYPQHTKFCPYRFLQGEKNVAGASRPYNSAMSPAEARSHQPRPQMFGFGKHMCPGLELAKLEILLFLKFFLPKYGYRLVEGQNLGGVMVRNAPKDGLRLVLTTTGA